LLPIFVRREEKGLTAMQSGGGCGLWVWLSWLASAGAMLLLGADGGRDTGPFATFGILAGHPLRQHSDRPLAA
jgi:hypothetical protein